VSGLLRKGIKKAISRISKRSTSRLKGVAIPEGPLKGKVIQEVHKGQRKGWRTLHFTDGTTSHRTKQEVSDFCRRVGTDVQLDKLKLKGRRLKEEQALRSLKFHYDRSPMKVGHKGAFTQDTSERMTKQHLQRLEKHGFRRDLSWVKTTDMGAQQLGGHASFPMPDEYVQILEGLGYVNIVKGRTKRLKR